MFKKATGLTKLVLIFCGFLYFTDSAYADNSNKENALIGNKVAPSISFSYEYVPGARGEFTKDTSRSIRISGDTCSNLTGTIQRDLSKLTAAQRKRVREFVYEGKFYCLPFVNHLSQIISSSGVRYVSDREIVFENGLHLVAQELFPPYREKEQLYKDRFIKLMNDSASKKGIELPPEIKIAPKSNGNYVGYLVNSVIKDHSSSDVLKAKITLYGDTSPRSFNFQILCWDCSEEMSVSPVALQESILFGATGTGIAFKGGIGIVEDLAAQRFSTYRNLLKIDKEMTHD